MYKVTPIHYGLLAVPLAMLGLPIYVYLPAYYAKNYGLSLTAIGTALLVARIVDIFTDPLIGHFSDQYQSVISRKKQILVGALLLLPSAYFLLIPNLETVTWFTLLGWSFLLYFAWTIIQVPYLAFAVELDYNNKTTLVSAREGLAIVGVLLVLILPIMIGQTVSEPAFYESFLLILIGLITISLLALISLQTKKVFKKSNQSHLEVRNPIKQLKWLKQQAPSTLKILPAYFLNNLANAIPATLFILFVNQFLLLSESTGIFLLVYFLAGILSLPFWLMLAKKYGRIRVWRFSILLSIISFIGVFLLEAKDFNLYLIICLLTGLSLAIDIALPAAIQTDLSRKIETEHSGINISGLLFGLWGMVTKLSLALAVGFGLPILDWAGYLNLDTQATLLTLYALPAILLKLWVWTQLPKLKQQLNGLVPL